MASSHLSKQGAARKPREVMLQKATARIMAAAFCRTRASLSASQLAA